MSLNFNEEYQKYLDKYKDNKHKFSKYQGKELIFRDAFVMNITADSVYNKDKKELKNIKVRFLINKDKTIKCSDIESFINWLNNDFKDNYVNCKKRDKSISRKITIYTYDLNYLYSFLRNYYNEASSNNSLILSAKFKEGKMNYWNANEWIEFRDIKDLTDMNIAQMNQSFLNNRYKNANNNNDKDCLKVIYDITEYYKEILNITSVTNLPLTKTQIIRRELKRKIENLKDKEKYRYYNTIVKLAPKNYKEYMIQTKLKQGGYIGVNSNYLSTKYNDNTIEDVFCMDATSLYPYLLLSKKFPMTTFTEVENPTKNKVYVLYNQKNKYGERKYAFYCKVKLYNVKAKTRLYTLTSNENKIDILGKCIKENDKIIKCEALEMYLTDVDLTIYLRDYDFDIVEVSDLYYSRYGYLPKELRNFIIEKYLVKEKSRGTKFYDYRKQQLNSIAGFCQMGIYGINKRNSRVKLNNEFGLDYSKPPSRVTVPVWGIWLISIGRRSITSVARHLGDDWLYTDTDSVFYKNPSMYEDYFTELNNQVQIKLNKILKIVDNVEIPNNKLGTFKLDKICNKIKFAGLKRYCYQTTKNEIKVTVAGIESNNLLNYLNTLSNPLNDFYKGLIVPANYSGLYTAYKLDFGIFKSPNQFTL